MQNHEVMAFRKRLKKRGYTKVSIFKDYENGRPNGYYEVHANEPLAKTRVVVKLTPYEMYHMFRF